MKRRTAGGTALTIIAWALGILFVFPVFWMVLTSFKQEADAYTDDPKFLFTPTLDQYALVFDGGLGPYLLNSLIATVISCLLVVVLAVPAAYALSIRPVKGTKDALFFFISTKMLPIVAAIVPIFVAAQNLHLLDNVWALVLLYTGMNLPIAVWMMRSFFQEVPSEVLEAAKVDGAGLRTELTRVLLPMVAPGIAATALICAIFAWNEFFFAVNLTAINAPTVPVFLVGFITSEGLYWARLSAAATLAVLPVVIVGWIAQRQLVRGLSMGALK
ncbi:carbohydrate ABC transporter permease [Saccharopolyspora sp. MS10]|uniref:carbohydrate ABC transporter permease n=1 Tax=Saccharopolyspora sp. MS10 TaxID=3385973 RepID=UPI0039A3CAD2